MHESLTAPNETHRRLERHEIFKNDWNGTQQPKITIDNE